VKPPTRSGVHEMKREQNVLDMDGIGSLLEAAREHCAKRYAEIAVIVLTGMRPGEVYGLKWDCVDFANSQLDVRRAVSDGVLEESTKNGSRRLVLMHPHLVEVLQAHQQLQLQENNKAKLATGLVFPSEAPTLREANSLDDSFEKLGKILNIDINLGNQVMRRSLNTNLLNAKVEPRVVRSQIGHTTEQMTALYYKAHVEQRLEAVARVPIRRRPAEKTE
jgi:integrase